MREAYFHEDDYCQIELLPVANWDFCTNQMAEMNAFSDQHRTDADSTDVFVRVDHPASISELSITHETFVASLRDLLPPFHRVVTGHGNHSEPRTQTIALGHDENVVIFAEHDSCDITKVWLTLDVFTTDDVSVAVMAFQILSQWPLLLADWRWSVLIRLGDADAISAYFDKRLHVFAELNRTMDTNPSA